MRSLLTVILVSGFASAAVSVSAQIQSRPSEAPIVSAENDNWFNRGEPIQFAGGTYLQAGAAVFFDGNRMVRSGSYNGVPLYVDTTIEAYSIVFVPIGRGLMQPYERPRSGELAGTTGSRAPSFPVSALPAAGWTPAMAASAPTSLVPVPVGSDTGRLPAAIGTGGQVSAATPQALDLPDAAPVARVAAPALTPSEIQKVREKVWIEYRGSRWIPAGPAIPLENSRLVRTGEYAGVPVFTFQGQDHRIFLPSIAGLVAPYELKR